MSRSARDHYAMGPAAGHAHGHTGNLVAANAPQLPMPSTINTEDARLLDPTYLPSTPFTSANGGSYQHYLGSGHGLHVHPHGIPYIDSQGTLHDPDYRPFPLIRHTKHAPSPFALSKPYWELELDESESINGDHNGEDGEDGNSSPNTPTSITPFIYYFVETHPLKRGVSPSRGGSSRIHGGNKPDGARAGRNKRGRARYQLRMGSAYMYATIATGLGNLGINRPSTHGPSPTTPNPPTVTLPTDTPTNITTQSNATNLEAAERDVEKEKRGWGNILRRTGKRDTDKD